MSLLDRLKRWFTGRSLIPHVSEWFTVRFDVDTVTIDVRPPKREPWTTDFRWSQIKRVCFKAEDCWYSDIIYVYTDQRVESIAIPIEADGGNELWSELLKRNLFDGDLATEAIHATEGLFCWPTDKPPSA